ncbi:MAG: histidine ammonia-lyase [Ignavibacteriales bacterium]
MPTVEIDGASLTLDRVIDVARGGASVAIADHAVERVKQARRLVDDIVDTGRTVYGVTTGFGKLSEIVIDRENVEALQRNLILSHSAGVGDPLGEETVRAILVLRINALSKGHSGIRLTTLKTLVEMLNRGVCPVVPEKGSLGASGDLAPLSHLCSVLIGKGEAWYEGRRLPGRQAMEAAGLEPVVLGAKEGLALINGTQVMTAIGCLAVHDAEILAATADICGAMTMEALRGIPAAYSERIMNVRPHQGAAKVAANLRRLVQGSRLTTGQGEIRVQDAYTLRCIPQVHGASRDAISHIRSVLETEINSATDNPLVFPGAPQEEEVLSGGNFHGQPVALAMDYLGIAAAELADISERRIERLVNPALSGLPAFLTRFGGINSGFMLVQYSAAALVSENKVLAHPASVDSIPSSANQEDHVSMGTIGARKAGEIISNVSNVLAMELLTAAQAVEFQGPEKMGRGSRAAYDLIRRHVSPLEDDRPMSGDISVVEGLVRSGRILAAVESAVGRLE